MLSKKYTLSCISLLTLLSCGTKKTIVETKTHTIRDTVYVQKNIHTSDNAVFAQLSDFNVTTSYFPAYGQDQRVRHVVLHYTSLNEEKSLRVLTQRDVSSHYLIGDGYDDNIYALVDENKRAWHAGVSKWKNIDNINFSSIGIEIVNETTGSVEIDFKDYTEKQIQKTGKLVQDIVRRYNIEPTNVVGHSDISPDRKHDPGPKFPWKRLYDEYGVGAWYDESDKNFHLPLFDYSQFDNYSFIYQVQSDLRKYGYNITPTGSWDNQTKIVIRAFQYHFRPEKYDGILDAETWSILQALLKKYNT